MKDNKSGKLAAIYILYIIVAGIIGILCGNGYKASLVGSEMCIRDSYIAAAYVSMRAGRAAVLMYAAGILGLSLAIFIVYGIGGVKKQ